MLSHAASSLIALALAIPLAALPLASGRADCAGVLEQLRPMAERISDPGVRQMVAIDLQRARIDVMEDDEEECATWVIHAARMMGMR